MNLQGLNEIFDTRRREMKKEKISYNFYTNVCNAWNKLNNFLITNNYIYDDNSKKVFLEKMKNCIRKKDYNYYVHAIELIDGIDNLRVTNRINRVIRNDNSVGISDNNSYILEKYLNSRKEYNRDNTLIDKKTITISLMKYFEEIKLNDYSELNIENIIELRNYCLSFELYSSKKRYFIFL